MFCKFCGKETDNLNGVCNDCAKKSNSLATTIVTAGNTYVCNEYTAKYGLGSAITAIILTAISVFLSCIAYFISMFAIVEAAIGRSGFLFFVNLIIVIGASACSIIGFIAGAGFVRSTR